MDKEKKTTSKKSGKLNWRLIEGMADEMAEQFTEESEASLLIVASADNGPVLCRAVGTEIGIADALSNARIEMGELESALCISEAQTIAYERHQKRKVGTLGELFSGAVETQSETLDQ